MHARASYQGWLLVVGFLAVAAITGLAYAHPSLLTHKNVQWTQIWSDNFTGPAGQGINTGDWRYQTGYGVFGNGEVENMTRAPGNVHLDGHGELDITALNQGGKWTSGRVQTRKAFTPPAGGELRVIAVLKQPDLHNALGYWPAFWMLGQGTWPAHGEIDILEDVNGLSQHSAALHCGNLSQVNPDGTFGPCHEHNGRSSGMLACAGCQSRLSQLQRHRGPAEPRQRADPLVPRPARVLPRHRAAGWRGGLERGGEPRLPDHLRPGHRRLVSQRALPLRDPGRPDHAGRDPPDPQHRRLPELTPAG